MDQLRDFTTPSHLPIVTLAVRLVVATVLGAMIGAEREWRRRPAGLRTHMLTALAAALFTVLTVEILHADVFPDERIRSDPVRIIEAVTAGVAFLAAGAIIRNRNGVEGLTTGAGMWLSGALGVAAGLGQFRVAALAAVLGLVILLILREAETALEDDKDGCVDRQSTRNRSANGT
jgi:putative Mg2+ transporter-C (MgtC) family protein